MTEKIVIYGAGGLGRETLQIVRATLCRQGATVLGFLDDGREVGEVYNDAWVLGGYSYLESITEPLSVVFGIMNPQTKALLYERMKTNPLLSFPNVIHPNAQISEYTALGHGIVIATGCFVSVDAAIGNFVFINATTMIGHDTTIGDFTSIMPLVAVSGNVEIGERVLIGVQSAIKQGVRLGSDCTVGMGSIVLRDVAAGETVLGNPAKRIA